MSSVKMQDLIGFVSEYILIWILWIYSNYIHIDKTPKFATNKVNKETPLHALLHQENVSKISHVHPLL